jgi:hypothetical protein
MIAVKSLLLLCVLLGVSVAGAAPAQVLLIRHGEKPPSGDDLSPRGWQRAYALVGYFEHNPAVTQFGTPAAIYAMGPKNSIDSSMRPVETVTPLAVALNLPIRSQYTKQEIQPLVEEIMMTPQYNGQMVLICWEHDMISGIAQLFGVSPPPQAWSDAVFDQVWKIDFSGNNVMGFQEFSQHLLPGDQ